MKNAATLGPDGVPESVYENAECEIQDARIGLGDGIGLRDLRNSQLGVQPLLEDAEGEARYRAGKCPHPAVRFGWSGISAG
jgi:hypothetical protein